MAFSDLDDQALVQKLVEQEHALVRARFQLSLGQLENTSSLRGLRKEIARLRTELRQRELRGAMPKNSLLALRRNAEVSKGASAAAGGGFLQGVVDKLAE